MDANLILSGRDLTLDCAVSGPFLVNGTVKSVFITDLWNLLQSPVVDG